MSQFIFYSDEMALIHSKIKQLAQMLLTMSSEISNGEQLISLYESEALEQNKNYMRKLTYGLKDISDDMVTIINTIDEICESVYCSEKYAYNALSGDVSKKDNSKYKSLDSDLGDCTVVQNYTYVNEILISQLKKSLSKLEKRMAEINAMKQYSDVFEDDWFHPVGSFAAREIAAVSEELSYYVSAIAASSALAAWHGQMVTENTFTYRGDNFCFEYTLSNNATGTSWAKDLMINGYGLHTVSGTTIDGNAGLDQLETEWEALTACHKNAEDASFYSGFRGQWKATPDSVTFDNDIDQYMYDHWYKNDPFFSFRGFMDRLYAS